MSFDPVKDEHPADRVEIEIKSTIESARSSGSGRLKDSKQSSNQPKARTSISNLTLAQLAPKSDFIVDPSGRLRNGSGDDPESDWGTGRNDLSQLADHVFHEAIRERVDNMLIYPSVLALNKVHGSVKARVVLGTDGKCDWIHTRIVSGEKLLRLYILSVVKSLCRQSLSSLWRHHRTKNVDLHFDFGVLMGDEDPPLVANGILGNTIYFGRYTRDNPLTVTVGPIILTPVAVGINSFEWFERNWDRFINGKDPMEDFLRAIQDPGK